MDARRWQILFSRLATAAIVVAMLLSRAPRATAQFEGDPELLKQAITKYRENLAKLHTWTGKVSLDRESHIGSQSMENPERRTQCHVDFAYDAANGFYRSLISTRKAVTVVDGREVPEESFFYSRGDVFRNGKYFNLILAVERKEGSRHRARASARPFSEPYWNYSTFVPMFFFRDGDTTPDANWQGMLDRASRPTTRIYIRREAENIIISDRSWDIGRDDNYTISLAQGGNLTEKKSSYVRDSSDVVEKYRWDWKQIGGVWVPLKASRDEKATGSKPDHGNIEFEWTDQKVNEPLPPGTFTLSQIGVRPGDIIYDETIHKNTSPDESEFPDAAPAGPQAK